MPNPADAVWQVFENEYRAYAEALRRAVKNVLEAEGDYQRASKAVKAALVTRLDRGAIPNSLVGQLTSHDATPGTQRVFESLDPAELRSAFNRHARDHGAAPEDALLNGVEAALAHLRLARRRTYSDLAEDFERRRAEAKRLASMLRRCEAHFLHRDGAFRDHLVPLLGHLDDGLDAEDGLRGLDADSLRATTGEWDLVLGLDGLLRALTAFRRDGRGPPQVFLHDVQRVPKPGVLLEDVRAADYWDLWETRHRLACVGTIERMENGALVLNGRLRLAGGWRGLQRWERACRERLWTPEVKGKFVPDFETVAESLAKEIRERTSGKSGSRKGNGTEAEERARQVFAEAAGQRALLELESRGRVTVESRDGKAYTIDLSGNVWERDTGQRVCVRGGGGLPRYEMLLARYLTLRDRPEEIIRPGPEERLMPEPHPGEAP